MRKRITLFALAFISFFTISKPCPLQGAFSIAAEWLYMLDGIERPYYSIDFNGVTFNFIGRQHANDQSWHSGYRLEGGYQFCETPAQLLLRWTHFPQFSNSTTVFGDQVLEISFATEVTESSMRDTFNFYSLEFLYDYNFVQNCYFSMSAQAGLQLANIRLKEHVVGSGINEVDLTIQSRRLGIGPEVGLELNYPVSNCFSFKARTHTSLLAAKKKSSFFEITNGIIDVDIKDDPYWLIIPALDIRLGLNYCSAFHRCFNFNCETGYEFITYLRALDRYSIYDEQNFYMNFMLHGPYLRLNVLF